MRRNDREVTDFSKMIEILKSCDCCRLGLVDENQTYIVPMNFGYDVTAGQVALYFHCAKEGRKIDLLPKQAVVSFEMDTKHRLTAGKIGCDFSYRYQCIMGTGTVDILSNDSEKFYGLQRIMEHYTEKTHWEFDPKHVDRIQVLKLSVKTWSCKEH